MKIILRNYASALIREEGFTEATIGSEEVSCLRPEWNPNGYKVFASSTGYEKQEPKEKQRIAATEVQRQNRREMWQRAGYQG